MKQDTSAQLAALIKKLRQDRGEHVVAIAEIDAVLDTVGMTTVAAPGKRGPGRPRGSKNKGTKKKAGKKASQKKSGKKKKKKASKSRGLRKGGSRVQGVKQTLEATLLTGSPQSPADLQAKVSKALGHEVAIVTQLHMLKREGKAKTLGRGQWVKS